MVEHTEVSSRLINLVWGEIFFQLIFSSWSSRQKFHDELAENLSSFFLDALDPFWELQSLMHTDCILDKFSLKIFDLKVCRSSFGSWDTWCTWAIATLRTCPAHREKKKIDFPRAHREIFGENFNSKKKNEKNPKVQTKLSLENTSVCSTIINSSSQNILLLSGELF